MAESDRKMVVRQEFHLIMTIFSLSIIECVTSSEAKATVTVGHPYKLSYPSGSVMLTQQQQLQLPARVFLVSPQLLLDLLVDPLVLSVLRRYATSSHLSNWMLALQ